MSKENPNFTSDQQSLEKHRELTSPGETKKLNNQISVSTILKPESQIPEEKEFSNNSHVSIVIVNFKTKEFLKDCLLSLEQGGITSNIYVVDNASHDGSTEMVHVMFPNVNLIENSRNLGFSKANNQALRMCMTDYILVLNPDTIVPPETIPGLTTFMNFHPDIALATVKLQRSTGEFDIGCRRTFPTIQSVLYDMTGLSKKFPGHKKFGKYYMTNQDENEPSEVQAASGAFMFLRKKVLDQIGLFDEEFFLLGEDLDLCYRIFHAVNPTTGENWKIFYHPSFITIHHSGKSRSQFLLRSSIESYRSTRRFYLKHYSSHHSLGTNFLIEGGLLFFGVAKIISSIKIRKQKD